MEVKTTEEKTIKTETKNPEPKIENKEIQAKEPPKQVLEPKKEADTSQTREEKLISYINSRSELSFKINDFLKSLFPLPKGNEQPLWLRQEESKRLRVMLSKMQNDGLLKFRGNAHLFLGTFYYPDSSTFKTEYHNLNTVEIFVEK